MASSDVTSVTNFFARANEGFTTTTSSSTASGAATVALTSVTGLTNGSIFVGIIEPAATNQQVFTGVVDTSGLQITGVVWTRGSNVIHASGSVVVDYITGTRENMLVAGLLVEHTQAGRHVMTSPKVITGINDTNNNELFKVTATASAVNEITVANAATTGRPVLSATGGDTNITWEAAGKGTGGFISKNPYKFSAYRSAAWNKANGPQKILFDTEIFDTSDNFDAVTNSRFTAPIAGFYQFNAAVNWASNSASSEGWILLYKNGVVHSRGSQASTYSGASLGFIYSNLVQLAASDYVEIYADWTSSSVGGNVGGVFTYFAGFLAST